ncbi:MAG TPA: hypothetical protein VHN15_01835 [Thermoanaerobaculia bacterium]|nr:hypothetical protein [Thermoanaerobaculia bacterium]
MKGFPLLLLLAGLAVAQASPPAVRFGHDSEGALVASVYSLPSAFFTAEEAQAFLGAVRQAAPERTLLVLADPAQRRALEDPAKRLRLRLLETRERPYSPWPRDPFSLVHTAAGGLQVLARPNAQPGREADLHLGEELVRALPEDLSRAWGGVTWAKAPVPFHNGQILLTPEAAWVTLHSLEPLILGLLGTDRVPVETFSTAAGIDRYLDAARRAARQWESLYGRPVRFVHPLPEAKGAPLAGRVEAMRSLGGGAGYDLDSLVTFLPRSGGQLTALVADLSAGRSLLGKLTVADWKSLAEGYRLRPEGVPAALRAAQSAEGAAALDGFLDLTAGHLQEQGLEVRRLPLLSVPVALLADREAFSHGEFLLTWNNVAVETRAGKTRAEGFASLLPTGDAEARKVFAGVGSRLDLFPPLVRSVILNGGYRCASNHVREVSAARAAGVVSPRSSPP